MRSSLSVALALSLVLGLPVSATQSTATQDATTLGRAVIEQLTHEEFAKVYAQFLPPMQSALPEEKLKATWMTIASQVGAFKKVAGARVEDHGAIKTAITTCEFERALVDISLAFDASGKIAGMNFRPATAPAAHWAPPAYADAGKFTESDVTVGSGEWALPGTLTLPNGNGPFAAVVLVHGSGPNDRDETLGPNKTFKDLALGLASRGIAVLRYDKRTKVHGAKMGALKNMTVNQETTDDAVLAVAALRGMKAIDSARIVVIGHSLGGMLMPRIGAADPKIAGLISMAGATADFAKTMARQTRYLSEADGRVTPEEQKSIDDLDALVKSVDTLTPAEAAAGKVLMNIPASYWLDLRGYDPPAQAKSLKQPMLILQGERDYQVTMVDDFSRWKSALGSQKNVTFKTYSALNHLFMPGVGKSVPAEYNTAGHVPEEVIVDIANWMATIK